MPKHHVAAVMSRWRLGDVCSSVFVPGALVACVCQLGGCSRVVLCVRVCSVCVCVSCTKPSSVLCRQTDTRDGRSDAVVAVRNQQVRRAEPCTPHLTPPAHANTVSCLAPMWSMSGACWVARLRSSVRPGLGGKTVNPWVQQKMDAVEDEPQLHQKTMCC